MFLIKIATLFLMMIAVVLFFLPEWKTAVKLRQQESDVDTRLDKAQMSNIALKKEYEALMTDPSYVEKVARDKLGYSKKGELVYTFRGKGTDEENIEERFSSQ